DWAIEVRTKINTWISDGNFKSIVEYDKQGKAFQLAIPTPEHYLPLIYTLGLKSKKDELSLFNDKMLAGSLSMTSVKIG
nr:4,5-DOPA dioxygenase extradiol [Saprospiraceae bacterium]